MIKFFLILVLVMTSVMALTRYLLRYCLSGDKLKIWSRRIMLLDIFSVFIMPLGYGVLKETVFAKYGIILVTIFFMTQISFDILMLFSLAVRNIRRRIINQIEEPVDEEKRRLIKNAALIPVISLLTSLYASFYERCHTVINKITIHMDNLPKSFNGFTIAQISDVHLGPYMDLEDLRILLEEAAATKTDMLVITGDLFDNDPMNFKAINMVNEYTESFPQGIYYCYGNHEHLRGFAGIEIGLAQTKIHVLKNTNEYVEIAGEKLYFAGVDYPMDREHFADMQEIYMDLAVKDIPENSPVILLAHHPDFFDSAVKRNVQLTLSGHTHGGQIGIMGVPIVPPVFKYMRGLYQQDKNYCYVHVGNGSWFPYRFGCPPEIAVFTLEG